MVHDGSLLRGEYRYSDLGGFSPTFFAGTSDDVFTNIHVVTQERPSDWLQVLAQGAVICPFVNLHR